VCLVKEIGGLSINLITKPSGGIYAIDIPTVISVKAQEKVIHGIARIKLRNGMLSNTQHNQKF
jgi:hypothetical protein